MKLSRQGGLCYVCTITSLDTNIIEDLAIVTIVSNVHRGMMAGHGFHQLRAELVGLLEEAYRSDLVPHNLAPTASLAFTRVEEFTVQEVSLQ